MENINVTIKPSHMVGNSWSHGDNPDGRKCPLNEALEEMFPDSNIDVGAFRVRIDKNFFEIPENWCMLNAEEIIKKANEGDMSEILVELTLY